MFSWCRLEFQLDNPCAKRWAQSFVEMFFHSPQGTISDSRLHDKNAASIPPIPLDFRVPCVWSSHDGAFHLCLFLFSFSFLPGASISPGCFGRICLVCSEPGCAVSTSRTFPFLIHLVSVLSFPTLNHSSCCLKISLQFPLSRVSEFFGAVNPAPVGAQHCNRYWFQNFPK